MSEFQVSRRRFALLGIGALGLLSPLAARAAGSFDDGHKLAVFLDHLQVESRWPAGVHVDWETGLPDGKTENFEGKHTHCSAFVASAAKQIGVYILRPPSTARPCSPMRSSTGFQARVRSRGWAPVADGYQAQRAANRGFLVVATYKNHDAAKPGHIAIVRPTSRTRDDILSAGPEIIMAGVQNYQATTVKHGFANHPTAFANDEIRYYQHDVTWP